MEEQLDIIDVYIELLDEGTETWRPAKAQNIGNGLYRLLANVNYNPEDEEWAFLPGDIVRIEEIRFTKGRTGMGVRHADLNVIRIDVEQISGSPFWIKRTNALSLGDGLYKVLPTPTYYPNKEVWKFSPDSIVRLKEIKRGLFTYLVASEK